MKEKILLATAHEMNQRGIKFTVDSVATSLGISKKTIYQFFSSKDELISQVIDMAFSDVLNQEQEILADEQRNFVDRITDLMLIEPKKYGKAEDRIIEDLRKYRFQDWERIEEFKQERILVLSTFLEKGIALGIVKKMNTKIAAKLLTGACKELGQYEFLLENNLQHIQAREVLTSIFLHGILEKVD